MPKSVIRPKVSLKFRTEIRDVPFLVYIRQEQSKRPKHHKLNVYQLMAIYNVCFGDGLEVKTSTIDELVGEGILLRSKSGKLSVSVDRVRYILSKLETFEMLKREGAGKGTKYRVMMMRDDFDWPATSLVHEHGQRGKRGDCLSMT